MLKPLFVQLYSLRTYAEKDFVSVLKKVAEIGYKGVEPAGFWNLEPVEFKKIIDDLGLQVVSSHSPQAHTPAEVPAIAETLGILGVKEAYCGYGPNDFKDLDAIKRTAENTSKLQEAFAKQGIELFQHNHYWEFGRLDGELKYEIYAKLCPKVKFEIDAFWSSNLGTEDPVAMVKKFADRTVLLHMKDGFCTQIAKGEPLINGLDKKIDLLPLGTGKLPIKEIIEAAPESCKAVIVELDYCDIEMWKAIEDSYKFMISNKLAAGNK